MTNLRWSRLGLWLVLATPGAAILLRWSLTPKEYGYGHAIGESGDWAAWLLMLTLAVTPMRLSFGRRWWTQWLVHRRRDLGLGSFAYAATHMFIYLFNKADLDAIWPEMQLAEYWTGWLAIVLFLPLAVTSNDRSMRAMKRSWKRLHKLVYPAAILTFVHWALTAFDPMTAYFHIGILAGIEVLRIALQRRQRVT